MKREMKLAVVVWIVLSLGGWARGGEPFLRIPESDRAILAKVAAEYELSGDSKRLLLAIRLIENGPPGMEMGVMIPASQRFKGHHAKSLELQAQYAAGTIKRRFTGNLAEFAERWAPRNAENDPKDLNRHWLSNARAILAPKNFARR